MTSIFKKNGKIFVGGDVVVETFIAAGENSHNSVRVRPIFSEGFSEATRVQCSRAMRKNHPVGTKFILRLTVRDTGETPTLYAHHDAPYRVVKVP
jgi:hypothetical protein